MKNNLKKVLIILALLLAIPLTLILVERVLELRKSAYFSKASIILQSNEEKLVLGGEMGLNIFFNSETKKISAARIALKYDNQKLRFWGERVLSDQNLPFTETIEIDHNGSEGLIKITKIAKTPTGTLKYGVSLFSRLVFEGLAAGKANIEVVGVELVGFNEDLNEITPDVAFEVGGDKVFPVEIISQTGEMIKIKILSKIEGVANAKVDQIPAALKVGRGLEVVKTFDNTALRVFPDGTVSLEKELYNLPAGDDYFFLLKPENALQRKICQNNQDGQCRIRGGEIVLAAGEENLIDSGGYGIEMGDLNADRVADSLDFSIVKRALSNQDLSADLDLNGVINSRDIILFLNTLSNRYEDLL